MHADVILVSGSRYFGGDRSRGNRGRHPKKLVMSRADHDVPLFREIVEMRPPLAAAGADAERKLVAKIGPEPRTPLFEAIRATLASLGCLPANGISSPDEGSAAVAIAR
jgi:hypothetical protein